MGREHVCLAAASSSYLDGVAQKTGPAGAHRIVRSQDCAHALCTHSRTRL